MVEAGEKGRVVSLLRREWAALAELLGGLTNEQWSRPALPGWDVHDVVAHVVGTERMLSGAGQPEVPPEATAAAHVRNEIARRNEEWVVDLRRRSHLELLGDFLEVSAARLAALDAMADPDFDAPSWTPVGDATYGRFMEVRVFDCWMHEQDVRAVTGLPGHEDGPVAEQSLHEVVRSLGYIVGKRAGVPDGASVTIRLTGPLARELHVVVDGRARVVADPPSPATAEIALGSALFLRLAGGRVDTDTALAEVAVAGDRALAHRLATSLAFTI
ncbi:MAG: maleylpyruvate isomerase family mycothiol-dependent enzyme [Acidimicrobiales bacterium]